MTRTTIGDAGVTVEQQPDGRWRWYDGKSWKTCRYGKMNLPTRAEAYADAQWVLGADVRIVQSTEGTER
jgi:hypothetical protein